MEFYQSVVFSATFYHTLCSSYTPLNVFHNISFYWCYSRSYSFFIRLLQPLTILNYMEELFLQFNFFGSSLIYCYSLGSDKEYKKAGFKMLFGNKRKISSSISIISSLITIIISMVPFFWNHNTLTLSIYAFVLIAILGIWFTLKSIRLYINANDFNAKKLMIASIFYLPLLQIIYIADKLIR